MGRPPFTFAYITAILRNVRPHILRVVDRKSANHHFSHQLRQHDSRHDAERPRVSVGKRHDVRLHRPRRRRLPPAARRIQGERIPTQPACGAVCGKPGCDAQVVCDRDKASLSSRQLSTPGEPSGGHSSGSLHSLTTTTPASPLTQCRGATKYIPGDGVPPGYRQLADDPYQSPAR